MTESQRVVSAAWLWDHLQDPQVVIADCRFSLTDPIWGQQQYQIGHLPGAYYLDLNRDLSGPLQRHGGRHPLPHPDTLSQTFTAMGLHSGDSPPPTLLVAYDDSKLAFAARLWWLAHYLGHPRVAVLDGGFTAWQRAGYSVTSQLPLWKSGRFIPQLRPDYVVDIATVKAHKELPGVALVDAREAVRYRGEQEPIDPIAGHIPGAVNYPWQEITDPHGYLRPLSEQQQRWAGLQAADEIIVYCGSGVTACVDLLSLAIAGISTGKLYAGSWSDWCSYQSPSGDS
ncbi:3-mercaptopyruvate sulfurtransferase [Neosynechococcus sphagnicola sy1]|uniref:3-mercaptopyruvate sulfurtransferase n=1 Tax=Neosynechococcus sphagnicola sy1 TaxID=1497020 RepID=A0A098TQW5_9CYAN|nr:sulfurtransferase [Neosynechococcus sphagnicola]KGF73223.1 3-mercaptopyruvate sulfurtransferase [Neosynechococcus sphagnicola sy1]